ncbi:hypothetical protein Barb6_00991 [Bacteroidales bacterium Barb6]|nr:hypothetical protein Barb6_00991 [Bacteroidales bacterium Barb6]
MNSFELQHNLIESRRSHPLTAYEQVLYHELVMAANRAGKLQEFSVANEELMFNLMITKPTLFNARRGLTECGLINYQKGESKGNKRSFGKYSINDLRLNRFTANDTTVSTTVSTTNCTLKKEENIKLKTKKEETISNEIVPSPKVLADCSDSGHESIDYTELVKFFNEKTKGVFGTIRLPLSDARKNHIRARIREFGKKAFSEMICTALSSDFLKGQNNRNFKATFDWMILPNNFSKIISGNYANRNETTGKNGKPVISEADFMSDINKQLKTIQTKN